MLRPRWAGNNDKSLPNRTFPWKTLLPFVGKPHKIQTSPSHLSTIQFWYALDPVWVSWCSKRSQPSLDVWSFSIRPACLRSMCDRYTITYKCFHFLWKIHRGLRSLCCPRRQSQRNYPRVKCDAFATIDSPTLSSYSFQRNNLQSTLIGQRWPAFPSNTSPSELCAKW